MNERLAKIKETAGKLGKKTILLIVIGALVLIGGAIALAFTLNNRPYEVLFSNLGVEEARQIADKLQEEGTEYKFQGESTILVRADAVDLTKAKLVQEGYPKSGFTYDTFKDNAGLMTTDSDKSTYKLYELQDRIGSTIRLFDGVKDAKVTIALGEESKYALTDESKTKTSASVVVTMSDGGSPTGEQAAAIQRLVAFGVPKMEMGDVAVFDGNGNDISVSEEKKTKDASDAEAIAGVIEGQIESKVEDVLGAIYGKQNVKASAKAKINMQKLIRETITYETPEKIDENDKKGILKHEEGMNETSKNDGGTQGVAGAETNADTPEYNTNGTGATAEAQSETYSRDFLVNQIKEQGSVDPGVLDDLTIAVAINGSDYGSLDEAQVRDMIGSAAGITPRNRASKISLACAPFYRPAVDVPPEEEPPAEEGGKKIPLLPVIIGAAVAVLLLLLLVILLLKKKKKKKKMLAAAEAAVVAEQPEIPHEVNKEILEIKNDKGMELKQNVRDFADQNPEIAAQLLKNWLNGGDENGQ